MAYSAPPFLTRLFRPFTSSARLNITPDSPNVTPNSASATAETTSTTPTEKCTIAAGCFWGVEKIFRRQFAGKGLIDARVGYIGGATKNPNYNSVCSGSTQHAEALQVTFNPTQLSYSSLIEFFYRMHDPTTKNRQGADTGTQYRSAIFAHSPEQAEIAQEVTRLAQAQWFTKAKIVTEISQTAKFWDAESYHQQYLEKNPSGYECPAHYIRKFPDLQYEGSSVQAKV